MLRCMALLSPPILEAASTAVRFDFSQYRLAVNVQVRYYTDAAGTVEVTPLETGSRNITATNTSTGYEGLFRSPGVPQTFNSNINNGTIAAAADGRWYELSLGGGLQNVTLVAAPNVPPGGAVSYRIIVDAPGDSALA